MIEETEYDDVVQCDHSYDRRCHTTYVTNYESQQEKLAQNCQLQNGYLSIINYLEVLNARCFFVSLLT